MAAAPSDVILGVFWAGRSLGGRSPAERTARYRARGQSGATHGRPYLYDSHIPLIVIGPGIRPEVYAKEVALNELAPTLFTLRDIETPAGSVGRALTEILVPATERATANG